MIELKNLTKKYGSFTAVDSIDLERSRRRAVRLPRAQRRRKDDDAAHDRRHSPADRRQHSHRAASISRRIRSPPRSKLGFIPDRPFIYEKLTGAEFLRFVAGLYGQDGDEGRAPRRASCWRCSISRSGRDELVESYSHGMRQKLIISSAFMHRPEVIVVDEPMVGLDPKAARILKDLFREYVRRGHTIMMSTHTLEVAETLCDRIAIIQHGKIRAVGTIDDLRAECRQAEAGWRRSSSSSRASARRAMLDGSPGCMTPTPTPDPPTVARPVARSSSRRARARSARPSSRTRGCFCS